MILEAHKRLNHAYANTTNKKCINEQLGYFGVPKTVLQLQCFIDNYPHVSTRS